MKIRWVIAIAGILVGVGLFAYSTAFSQGQATLTAPTAPPGGPSVAIPAGQSYCQQATFSTSSTTFVAVPVAVRVNNTALTARDALLRWTGVAAHLTPLGWINVAPMRDGVALPATPGQWFLAYDLDNDGVVSDTFGIQWKVSVPPGAHLLQPAMSSSSGGGRNIDGFCFSVELKTK